MNICRNDIYFFIILLILIYLFYKIYKLEKKNNEKFDSVSDTKALINQVYNADIEAIRNLSSIASKLIKEGGLVVPGKLQVNDQLTTNSDLILAGQNKWIVHTPDDQRRIMYIAPFTNTDWDWNNGININNNGAITANIVKAPRVQVGGSHDGVSSTITDSAYEGNSLCLVGQGVHPNRKITMWDYVQVNGSTLTTGNTQINGNANINGKLTVNDQVTTGNATINGTLNVNRIVCNGVIVFGAANENTKYTLNGTTSNCRLHTGLENNNSYFSMPRADKPVWYNGLKW